MAPCNPFAAPGVDVAVVGAGPAGAAVATSLAEAGARVALIGPRAPWVNTLCFWTDEVPDPTVRACASAEWPSVSVQFGEDARIIDRGYGCFDNARLQAHFDARFSAAGGAVVAQSVWDVVHDAEGSVVDLESGAAVRARVVMDCTGHEARFVRRSAGAASLFQTAYGLLAEVDGLEEALPRWMDFRHAHLTRAEDALPTFLYALPTPDGRWFVEETALVRGPAVSMAVLRDRLERRLAHMGAKVRSVIAEERCVIPMDAPLPALDQRVVGFGGAASMVHPASGFMVAASIAAAPALARVIVDGLGAGMDAARVARAAWAHLWPADRIRARNLHLFGANALAGMDAAQTRRFFTSFFELPSDRWRGFLSAATPSSELASTMFQLFRAAPMPVRWSLVSAGAPSGAVPLFRAVLGA